MTSLNVLLVSSLVGVLVFVVARRIIVVRGNAAQAIGETKDVPSQGQKQHPKTIAGFAGALLARYIPAYAESLQSDLYWVIFEENAEKKIVHSIDITDDITYARLGRQVLQSIVLGVLALIVFKTPAMLLIGGVVGWTLSRSDLKAKAESMRAQVTQELPEFVQLMAAETASGSSLDTVIERVAQGPGLSALWMRNILAQANGRSLFERHEKDAQGLLHYEASRTGDDHLVDLAVQLRYAIKGNETRALLQSLAARHADDYVAQASVRAKKLGGTLSGVSAMFFFLPFVVLLLVIVGIPMMKMLGGN